METISRECPTCGITYQAEPRRLRFGRQITCSRACSYRYRGEKKSKSVTLQCPVCGEHFKRSPALAARAKHGSIFCSRKCHYAGRSLGLTKRVVTSPYRYTPETKAALVAAARKPKGKRVFHPLTCTNCGKIFEDPSSGRKRKSETTFCSLDCCNAYRTGAKNPAWRGGHPHYYGPSWRAARRAIRLRDKCCRRCGATPERALDIHHIRPVVTFANPDDAHYPENLVGLCHPCHMWVEWNGIDFDP
jgi:hypothetical protein